MGVMFQRRVAAWVVATFSTAILYNKRERVQRFFEEAVELAQAGRMTAAEAHHLVNYVFDRPVGELGQEIGGVMNTLAALCEAHDVDMERCGEIEIDRCWVDQATIRTKHKTKPNLDGVQYHRGMTVAEMEAEAWVRSAPAINGEAE